MVVSMKDITSRLKPAPISRDLSYDINSINLYHNDKFLENNAIYMINNWVNFDENTNIAYSRALDVFIELCENVNKSKADTAFNFVFDEIFKVRDAKQLQNSISYKISRLKTNISTKIKSKSKDNFDSLTASIGNLQSKLKPALVSTPVGNGGGENKDASVAEYYLSKLLDKSKVLCEADRIIQNYNTISKRYDIDKMVSEIYSDNDIYFYINEICTCIDTYDEEFKNKYNSALETVWYGLNKSYINYPSDKIIESVTDYFIFNSVVNESDIEFIKNNNVLFESSEFDCIDYMFETIQEQNIISVIDDYNTSIVETSLSDKYNKVKNDVKQWPKGNPEENEDKELKKMIDDFRAQCAKDKSDDKSNMLVTHLKALVNKIFATKPESIVKEIPSIFSIIRTTFIFGSAALHPVLGIISLITDFIIKNTVERKQCDKYIERYESEIKSMKNKLSNTTDDYNKKRYEAYIKELEKDLEKIEEFSKTLYTDDENEEREEKKSKYKYDDDFDIDFDSDFGFDESQLTDIASIITISELVSNIENALLDKEVDGIVYDNIFKMSNDTIDTITDFSITVPDVVNKNDLCYRLENYREQLRSEKYIDYMRLECINSNISKIKESTNIYNTSNDAKSVICTLMWLDEVTKLNSDLGYVNEMTFTNTLKLALNKLKNTAIKLSGKEKQISNNIDFAVNNVAKGIENAMHTDNREAIINGKIIPSASKVIKLAITTGLVWSVSPAVAVIGVLGTFACYKKNSAKERQLVLDDIEIELKMCDRYLKLAEEKNDMKSIKQIEIIQRNLLRQQQRIKYKMKVYYKQDVPSTTKNDD